jgi:hypothetical protein
MSCPEEFGRLELAISNFIRGMAYFEVLRHQCRMHEHETSCRAIPSWDEDIERRAKELIEAVTDLSRCIERAVRR